jgi:hypothetical protein
VILSWNVAGRVRASYVHEWRERGLSDHAAIWAEVEADAAA